MISRYRCETCSYYSYPIKDVPSCDHPVVGKHTYLSDEVRFAYNVRGCTFHSDFEIIFEKLLSDIDDDAQVVDSTMHTNRDYVVKMSDVEYHIKEYKMLVKKK